MEIRTQKIRQHILEQFLPIRITVVESGHKQTANKAMSTRYRVVRLIFGYLNFVTQPQTTSALFLRYLFHTLSSTTVQKLGRRQKIILWYWLGREVKVRNPI